MAFVDEAPGHRSSKCRQRVNATQARSFGMVTCVRLYAITSNFKQLEQIETRRYSCIRIRNLMSVST